METETPHCGTQKAEIVQNWAGERDTGIAFSTAATVLLFYCLEQEKDTAIKSQVFCV